MPAENQAQTISLQHGMSTPNARLREANRKVLKRAIRVGETQQLLEAQVARISEKHFGKRISITESLDKPDLFPVMDSGFSWKGIKRKLQEAESSTSFTQLLRAGIQTIVNSAYMDTPDVTYQDWVKVVPSSKDTEPYAPIQGISFPREVGRQEKYPEVNAAGLNLSLKNRKYGTMYALEEELIEDDQTGQMIEQVRLLGEYMQLLNEVLCYGKLASVANMNYGGFAIPKSETKPDYENAAYPWLSSANPFRGGGINRPTSFGLLTKDNFQAAKTGLMNQLNLLGLKMVVNGNRLLVGPTLSFDSAVLMNSSFYPSATGTSGTTGGSFAINPIKGMADISVSRFIFNTDGSVNSNSKAWYLVDDSRPWFVLQMREAVSVIQEAENAGESFDRDIRRWKVNQRANADFIDPRFAWQGNDGSVTS